MKNKGYINMMKMAQAGQIEERHKTALYSRQQTLDKVVIALNYMGFEPERIRDFAIAYQKAEQDYCETVLVDAKDDKEIWYAKGKIDQALKQALPEDMFHEYDERYSF